MTTIAISNENYLILKKLGQTGDSFNDVLTRILAEKDSIQNLRCKEQLKQVEK
jgi:predicted CopG family antitoxin